MRKDQAAKLLLSGAVGTHQRVCHSCFRVWSSEVLGALEAFALRVPGADVMFVCPNCRHMRSYVPRSLSVEEV